ncbi:hypothetical protein [Mesorhizobium sp. BE184]|uniref:hypothetical protein n=1 Tax=Mesorhizobium sp. BE184 TaxID=2817714 RepID=UPI0028596B92|nr:hypothetical protein [Mesorhizobium sp. BE184]MDR7034490.1 hypothetical protein [Mesorhizobium sp. BE184]
MDRWLKWLVAAACCVVILIGSFWATNQFFSRYKQSAAGAELFADTSYSNLDIGDISLITRKVTEGFFDPEAARFYAVNYSLKAEKRDKSVICGYVNGRNRMGGYIGIEPFFYNRESNTATMLPTEIKASGSELFQTLVTQLGCPP